MEAASRPSSCASSRSASSSRLYGTATGLAMHPDAFFEGDGRQTPFRRSASSPWLREQAFSTTARSDMTTTGHLTGMGVVMSGRSPHLPGYKGYIPGFRTEHAAVGKAYGKATMALDAVSPGRRPLGPPPRFVMDE
eukprot:SRR837773.9513.p1 GENE.SRR837773.9513~~SRR837773.9513.p1  ORF type:complete len:156 (+),score=21.31 SRR837773.9513:61-468(+)